MAKGSFFIGTSGWHYKHWKNTFYPETIKQKDQFAFYQNRFSTVEINNSFYRLPTEATFTSWRQSTGPDFIFSVKVPRFITHMKKLGVGKPAVDHFLKPFYKLEEKLGPVLFQLPPKWRVNKERLRDFLKILHPGLRYTFEFREHSWYDPEIYAMLKEYKCAFCIYELERHLSPIEVTADFVYIRLHGPGNKYQGSYTDEQLKEWAKKCRAWQKRGLDVYIYFDNDEQGFAAFNAARLIELLT